MSSVNHVNSGAEAKTGCVLLAAGRGNRFGANKLQAQFEGKPLVHWAFSAIPTDIFDRIVVVTAYPSVANLAVEFGYDVIANDKPEEGASRSVRLGMSRMEDMDRCVFCVCDQPFMSAASIRRLVADFQGGIRALHFGDRRGNPVIFGKEFFPELLELDGPDGGSQLMRKHPEAVTFQDAECASELLDVDTIRGLALAGDIKNFFLTGAPGVGKRPILREVTADRDLEMTGFQTMPYEVCGQRAGYYMHGMSPDLPDFENNKPISVLAEAGESFPVTQSFDRFGSLYLSLAVADAQPLVLMDALGPLERKAFTFRRAVDSTLGRKKPVLGVLKEVRTEWVHEIRARRDTRVVRVLPGHEDEAAAQLKRFLDCVVH